MTLSVEEVASDRQYAKEIHRKFRSLPGSEHIASRFALAKLSALLRKYSPDMVVEIGAGIGTISYVILNHSSFRGKIVATETDDFCMRSLERNLSVQQRERLSVVNKFGQLATAVGERPSLLIIDGDWDWDEVSLLAGEGTLCFVEGTRRSEINEFSKSLNKRHLQILLTKYAQGRMLKLSMGIGVMQYYPVFNITMGFKDIKGCHVGQICKIS